MQQSIKNQRQLKRLMTRFLMQNFVLEVSLLPVPCSLPLWVALFSGLMLLPLVRMMAAETATLASGRVA
jgi:hypothetical protein